MKSSNAVTQRWREIFARPAHLSCKISELTFLSAEDGSVVTVDRSAMLDALSAGQLKSLRFAARVGNDGPNTKFLRPKGDFAAFARGFTGRPFLKDHGESLDDKGGKILSSEPVPGPNGRTDVRQVVELNQPWSMKYLLDGTFEEFSLGWAHDTPECSICSKDIWSCWDHTPGKSYGGKLCELLTPNPLPLETSAVLFGAATDTGIEGVSLSALSAMREEMKVLNREKEKPMREKILSFLGLTETATDEEIVSALDARTVDGARLSRIALLAELPETATLVQIEDALVAKTSASVSKLTAEVVSLKGEIQKRDAKMIVSAALTAGKISAAQVPYWERRAVEDPAGTKAVLEQKGIEVPTTPPPAGSIPPPATTATLSGEAAAVAARLGVTPEAFLKAQQSMEAEAEARAGATA